MGSWPGLCQLQGRSAGPQLWNDLFGIILLMGGVVVDYALLYFVGDGGRRLGAATVAGHDVAAGGSRFAVDEYLLGELETLVAPTGHLGGNDGIVVETYLAVEIDVEMDYHDAEIAFFGYAGHACGCKILILSEVEIFHDAGVVDVAHLVDIVESDLDWECVHNNGGGMERFFGGNVGERIEWSYFFNVFSLLRERKYSRPPSLRLRQ